MRWHRIRAIAALLAFSLGAACGGSDDTASARPERDAAPVAAATTTAVPARPTTSTRPTPSTTVATVVTTTAPISPTAPPAPAPSPPAPPAPPPPPPAAPVVAVTRPIPGYDGTVGPIDASRLHASWRPGCPVGPEQLRLLTLPYVGYDGGTHTGELVVHADVAADVTGVFAVLHGTGYPIERMVLVDVYGGDDDASTRANNTSAFNCRATTGGTRWSEHAYGRAVDLNPVPNPYVRRDGSTLDPNAQRYTDRTLGEPAMIVAGDEVVQAFGRIGWSWGGTWSSVQDYQHFSQSGR